ncbi:MAG: hypothetical protein QXS54_00930 [Candidatus Methanomethylicaceae archaeon]
MCGHVFGLGPHYPGRYCIYCGREIATVRLEDGQIALYDPQTETARRYVAVIFRSQQRPVTRLELGPSQSRMRLFLDDGRGIEVDIAQLIMAFQDSEEVLRIEEA